MHLSKASNPHCSPRCSKYSCYGLNAEVRFTIANPCVQIFCCVVFIMLFLLSSSDKEPKQFKIIRSIQNCQLLPLVHVASKKALFSITEHAGKWYYCDIIVDSHLRLEVTATVVLLCSEGRWFDPLQSQHWTSWSGVFVKVSVNVWKQTKIKTHCVITITSKPIGKCRIFTVSLRWHSHRGSVVSLILKLALMILPLFYGSNVNIRK